MRLRLVIAACLVLLSCNISQTDLVLMNGVRADANIRSLIENTQLKAKAQAWADRVGDTCVISHSSLPAGAPSGWHKLGENIAIGGDVEALQRLLMASKPHRSNILDPAFSEVGIGFSEKCGGVLVQDFSG